MKKPYCDVSREVLEFIDPSKKVRVYRNLHKNCLSIQQGGIVKCHAGNVVLKDGRFIVNKGGQARVRLEGKKNVHAFIEGMVVPASETYGLLPFGWESCRYNPYTCDTWQDNKDKPLLSSKFVNLQCDSFGADVLAYDILYHGLTLEKAMV